MKYCMHSFSTSFFICHCFRFLTATQALCSPLPDEEHWQGDSVPSPGPNQGPRATSPALYNVHPLYLSAPWLGTWASSCWCYWTRTSTHPCIFSSVTCLWWTFVTPQLSSHSPGWIHSGDKVISYDACAAQMFFLQPLPLWKITFWPQWPMIA